MAAATTTAGFSPLWRRFSVRHLLVLTPWVGVVIGASRPIRDNSFLWHVRAGELQLTSGKVLTTDPFSYTMAGEPWRTQSWLADLLYGVLEKGTGGVDWVPWLLILCGGLVVGLVGWSAYRHVSDPLPVALGLVTLIWLGFPNLVPRPVLFSFVLLALLVVVLEVEVEWAAPLVLWVWAGLHGSFALGIGLVLLDALRRRAGWRRIVGRVSLMLLAVSLTAHGFGVWSMLASFVKNRGALDFISEWAAPDLLSLTAAPYALLIAAILVAAVAGRIEVHDLWVVVPFLLFGLSSARAVMPATIVLVPFAVSAWAPGSFGRETVPRYQGRVNVAFGIVLIVLPFVTFWGFDGVDDERFPVEAATHLKAAVVWHDDATGGYLIYSNRLPVFIDDRAELYGPELFREFVETRYGAPAWRTAFKRYGIDQVLVRSDAGLAGVLAAEDWKVDFADDHWTVFSRS